ncbi:RNA-guided endonuclease InsQ/TnpB family protein [Oxynema aestuarii]|uniref:Transposase n=1 Tax=Oxynema aestuarii AP17 TaxID=2064643 RepID=A0A6H1U1E3_9CYAN|nr:RNA-guided endonuclease TnpB family protein [Oxynema aestuarii]QIZ72266.1 transposase [Oxynema aestuarii AP17]
MFKAYKYRIYPTPEQQATLAKSFGCCRWYWNYALNLCQETYRSTGKGLSRGYLQGLLPTLKKEYPWLKKDVYSQCLQVVALNLSTAYRNFFEKRAKLPRFKSKQGRQSISYPQNVKFEGNYIKLPKVGLVRCRQHRSFEGKIKTVTLSKNPDGKYYASVLVEGKKEPPLLSTEGKAIGIDLGLTDFAITSEGSKYNNPKHFDKHARNLKRKQQKHARKRKGSNNRNKSRVKVAKIHAKISRCREDFLHKLSRKIVNENQVIVVESPLTPLNKGGTKGGIGMVRHHQLAKAISDVGWGMFCTMLKYKAESEGKVDLEVDRFFPSSKTCHVCLNQIKSLSLDVRSWTCEHCQTHHDRDINAAINLKNEGLRILELGTRSTALGGDVRRCGRTSVLSSAVPSEEGSRYCNL